MSQLLTQGFTNLDGAIIYSVMRKLAENVKPENIPDLTGFECFVNHILVQGEKVEFMSAV